MATKIADLNAMLTMNTASFTTGVEKVTASTKTMGDDFKSLKQITDSFALDAAVASMKKMAEQQAAMEKTRTVIDTVKRQQAAVFEFGQTYQQTATAVGTSSKAINADMSRSLGGMSQSSSGASRAVTQLGFAIQDFHSQLGTRGIGGAISAVTNNVQMMGAALGPTGLAVTAVGGAIAGIAVPALIDWVTNSKSAKAAADELAKSMEGLAESVGKASDVRFNARQTGDQVEAARERVEAWKRADEEIRRLGQRRAALQAEPQNAATAAAIKAAETEARKQQEFQRSLYATKAELRRDEVLAEQQTQKEKEIISISTAQRLQESLTRQQKERDAEKKQYEKEAGDRHRQQLQVEQQQRMDSWKQEVDTAQSQVEKTREMLSQQATTRGSAAMVGGTQEAAQFMNRVTSGTRSEGDVLRRQLRVQEDMLKELRDNKPTPVASI